MKLKDLKKIIAEELETLSAEPISEGPCGMICSWNGVHCCSTACDGGDCQGCCLNNLMNGHVRPVASGGKGFNMEFYKAPMDQQKDMSAAPITHPSQRPPRGM